MAIQIQGNGGVVAEVDGTTFRALRVTIRPVNYGSLGFYRAAAISGTMAVSLGASAELFQFRWSDATNLALMYFLNFSASGNVAAGAATLLGVVATIARSWSAAGTGGTRFTMTGNNAKLRTSMGTSLVNDIGISTTAGLTAGTKTFDTTNMAAVSLATGTGAITTAMALPLINAVDGTLLDASREGQHPVVMAQNEGVVIRNHSVAWPTGLTWNFAVQTAWAEAAAF
jgi:hypothetical protein